MAGPPVEDHIGGVEPQAIEMKLFQPHPDIAEHEFADGVAAGVIVIDSVSPGCPIEFGEIRAEFAEIIRFRTEMVVDNIKLYSQSRAMASVDEPLQPARAAVRILDRVR